MFSGLSGRSPRECISYSEMTQHEWKECNPGNSHFVTWTYKHKQWFHFKTCKKNNFYSLNPDCICSAYVECVAHHYALAEDRLALETLGTMKCCQWLVSKHFLKKMKTLASKPEKCSMVSCKAMWMLWKIFENLSNLSIFVVIRPQRVKSFREWNIAGPQFWNE